MSLAEKTEFPFFDFPIFRYSRFHSRMLFIRRGVIFRHLVTCQSPTKVPSWWPLCLSDVFQLGQWRRFPSVASCAEASNDTKTHPVTKNTSQNNRRPHATTKKPRQQQMISNNSRCCEMNYNTQKQLSEWIREMRSPVDTEFQTWKTCLRNVVVSCCSCLKHQNTFVQIKIFCAHARNKAGEVTFSYNMMPLNFLGYNVFHFYSQHSTPSPDGTERVCSWGRGNCHGFQRQSFVTAALFQDSQRASANPSGLQPRKWKMPFRFALSSS